MKILTLSDIQPFLQDKAVIIETVRSGFIQHSQGGVTLPTPMQMVFRDAGDAAKGDYIIGDCHVKSAFSSDLPYFCIKIATGFYSNPSRGLAVNNGSLMLLSAQTGAPLALFQDEGHITSTRTAAAGALAVSLYASSSPLRLGIIGTGHQAELQARWAAFHNPVSDILIWGRSPEKASRLAAKLGDIDVPVRSVGAVAELASQSDVIITTTPATSPVLSSDSVISGHHIVALGADSPGKVEIDPDILRRADYIFTDDHDQCLEHGDFGHAVRAGCISADKDMAFGAGLEEPKAFNRLSDSISVVDLTGLGVQDLALASLIWETVQGS